MKGEKLCFGIRKNRSRNHRSRLRYLKHSKQKNRHLSGAGATLIAGVHVIRKQLDHCDPPKNYQNHILVVAQDVDEIVGLMCYIQISLLGLAGFIKIGNSITDPMSTDDSSENYWYTPMYFSDVWSTRRMLRQINKLFGKGDDE